MVNILITGATLFGGACLVYSVVGIAQEMRTDYYRTKRTIRKAIYRARMAMPKLESRSEKKQLEMPKFISLDKTEYGYLCKYLLPVGVTQYDCFQRIDILEGALNAEINMWVEGQVWHMEIYNHPVPKHINYLDVMKHRKEDTVLLGLSRKGVECLDFKELVNPHIMIGGMAGVGKSNCMNVIITQLLSMNTELYLIDPKRVEFNIYENISKVKSLGKDLGAGVQIANHVVNVLRKREEYLDQLGYQNIHSFNRSNPESELPYVFLIVDEFSDFEGVKAFWENISAIARKGRALGVYLIMATQRPSADVLPPSIKANLGVKLAFKVTTLGNSKILIENEKALLLPNMTGRAILDIGIQRQMQVPFLDRKVHSKLLNEYKGDVQNGFNSECNVVSSRASTAPKRNRKSYGNYGVE